MHSCRSIWICIEQKSEPVCHPWQAASGVAFCLPMALCSLQSFFTTMGSRSQRHHKVLSKHRDLPEPERYSLCVWQFSFLETYTDGMDVTAESRSLQLPSRRLRVQIRSHSSTRSNDSNGESFCFVQELHCSCADHKSPSPWDHGYCRADDFKLSLYKFP